MKLVHCLECGDIIRPRSEPRSCQCGRHTVWWTDARRWRLAAHDAKGSRDGAYLFRISNVFVRLRGETSAETIREILDAHPEDHHFAMQGSPIVKTRIGESEDAFWSDRLPAGKP